VASDPNAKPIPFPERTEERLESWKEIAAYLKRDIRTVQRWEKREGFPVRRHHHDKLGSVYVLKSELDQWWLERGQKLDKDATPAPEAAAPGRNRLPSAIFAAVVLVAATWGLLAYLRPGPETGLPSFRQVAAVPGAVSRVSPDGRWLAYVEATTRELWLQEVSSGQRQRITEDAVVATPAWSRDSRRVAVVMQRESLESPGVEVRTLDVRTRESALRWRGVAADLPEPHDWLPDDATLLCRVRLAGNRAQIALLPPDRARVTPVATAPAPIGALQLSPDGRYVVYSSMRRNSRSIYLQPLQAGAKEIRLTESAGRDGFPFWTPDGRSVVFLRQRGTSGVLWAVRINPRDGSRVEEVFLKVLPGSRNRPVSITSKGELFFARQKQYSRVFVLAVDSATGRPAGPPRSSFEDDTYDPVWARSGRLSYRRTLPDDTTVLALRNVVAGTESSFRLPPSHDVLFLASPAEGDRFTFYGVDPEGRRGFFDYWPNADEVSTVWLTEEEVRPPARWSSDGTDLLYSGAPQRDGRHPIRAVHAKSGEARTLGLSRSRPFAKWSPSGTEVAYTDGDCLKVLARSGGEARQIVCAPASLAASPGFLGIGGLGWSPDGSKLAWTVNNHAEKRVELWIVDRSTGAHSAWPGEVNYASWPADPTWAPNPTQVAFRMGYAPEYEVWSLRNVLP